MPTLPNGITLYGAGYDSFCETKPKVDAFVLIRRRVFQPLIGDTHKKIIYVGSIPQRKFNIQQSDDV